MTLQQIIEQMIELLDLIDGDADLEDDATGEFETDMDEAPVSLNRDTDSPLRAVSRSGTAGV